MRTYQEMRTIACNANFDQYCDTVNEDGIRGIILVATQESEFFGEAIDLFEDGTYIHYNQFKGQTNKFSFN